MRTDALVLTGVRLEAVVAVFFALVEAATFLDTEVFAAVVFALEVFLAAVLLEALLLAALAAVGVVFFAEVWEGAARSAPFLAELPGAALEEVDGEGLARLADVALPVAGDGAFAAGFAEVPVVVLA